MILVLRLMARGFSQYRIGTNQLKGVFMASETFKKRQKEMARKEKQQKKAARRLERRDEKARMESKVEGENPNSAETVVQHGPTIL
jgi:transposase